MAKNPTIAMLIAKAIELNSSLTEETARELIKAAGAKSYKKVAEAVEAAKPKKPATKTPAKDKEVKLVEAGPRGFRFGPAYVESIIDGAGIAFKPANQLKLLQFAETVGVTITKGMEMDEVAKLLKKPAAKFHSENFEQA